MLAALEPRVFAPGVVSRSEPDLFRGQFTPDGEHFYFFRKVTPDQEDYRIFVTRRRGNGWDPAERVDLGGESSDFYPAVSPDGRRLVFSSYRSVPGDDPATATANLWVAERRGGTWAAPRLLQSISALDRYDAGPRFDRHGDLVWTSVSADWSERLPRRASWQDGDASGFEADASGTRWQGFDDTVHVWDVLEEPMGRFAILGISRIDPGTGRRGPSDLWIARRDGDGWERPRDLGPAINTEEAHENFAVFSTDGRELLFCRGFQTYFAVSVAELLAALGSVEETCAEGAGTNRGVPE